MVRTTNGTKKRQKEREGEKASGGRGGDLKGGVCGLLCGMPTQGRRRPGSPFNIQNV